MSEFTNGLDKIVHEELGKKEAAKILRIEYFDLFAAPITEEAMERAPTTIIATVTFRDGTEKKVRFDLGDSR